MIVSHHLRILLVDDDQLVAMALAEACRAAGHSVTCAHNGHEGVSAFAAAPFDVLVTDLNMPGYDGRRLIRTLRTEWPCLPIIVVTADPPSGGVRALKGDDPGVTMLLSKPTHDRALLAALRAVFEPETQTELGRSLRQGHEQMRGA